MRTGAQGNQAFGPSRRPAPQSRWAEPDDQLLDHLGQTGHVLNTHPMAAEARVSQRSVPPLARLGAGLLCLAAFTSPWNGISVGGLQLVDLLLIPSLGCLLLGGGSVLEAPAWVWTGTGAILLVTFIQRLLNIEPGYGAATKSNLQAAIQWLVAVLVLPLLVVAAVRLRRDAAYVIAASWAFGCATSAAAAISDYVGASSIGASLGYVGTLQTRQSGLASHPNGVGVGAVVALPILLLVISRTPNRLARFGTVVALLLCLLGVYASGSRGAAVGAALLITFALMASPRVRRRVHLMVPILLFVGAASVFLYSSGKLDHTLGTLRLKGDSASAAQVSNAARADLAAAASGDFQAHPVAGAGVGYITRAHSVPLQLLSSGGLILFTGFAIYILGGMTAAYRLRQDLLATACGLSVATWMLVGLVENQLTDRYLYIPISCLAALMLSQASGRGQGPRVAEHVWRPRWVG